MLFRRQKPVVGLDIGSSAVKAVELKASGKGWKVVAFGIEALPPDAIVDGAIIDGTAVADAIRRLFERLGIKNRDVAASLSCVVTGVLRSSERGGRGPARCLASDPTTPAGGRLRGHT